MGGATGRPPEEQLSRRWPALLGTGAVAAMHSEVVVKKPESLPYGGEWSGLDARRRGQRSGQTTSAVRTRDELPNENSENVAKQVHRTCASPAGLPAISKAWPGSEATRRASRASTRYASETVEGHMVTTLGSYRAANPRLITSR
jgi:hypothetical protein